MTLAYQEHAPPGALAPYVICTWRRTIGGLAEPATILPDGCIDLVAYPDGSVHVAGPDTAPSTVVLAAGQAVGLRFQIGRAPGLLGVPAAELRDRRVPLTDVWGRGADGLQEQVAAVDVDARRGLLLALVERRLALVPNPDDGLVDAAVTALADGGWRVGGLARELAVSERQLRRRFDRAVGYGPKTLDRVLRARRLLRALGAGRADDLALLARDLGYADQAHMTRDAAELLGATPGALRASALAS